MPRDASVFAALLQPICRRRFKACVQRHRGDAYDKSFSSWSHLVALVFAQLSGLSSLRGLAQGWSTRTAHHYHLGAAPVARSTLADANARRPAAIFAQTFADLAARAGRRLRKQTDALVTLIDASPIPLGPLMESRAFNGRIKGAKLHLVYDPNADLPQEARITPANVNDVAFTAELRLVEGATYVFDKGYCSLAWWRDIHDAKAFFVTRAKTNAALQVVARRPLEEPDPAAAPGEEDGVVLADETVRHASKAKGRVQLGFLMRRIIVRRADGRCLTILTNDLAAPAARIAALYKQRWQIELVFRWIKQNLKIRRFLGRGENAVKLQIFAALIAYVLLRLAARTHIDRTLSPLRFLELVRASLFERTPIAALGRPPPNRPPPVLRSNQLALI